MRPFHYNGHPARVIFGSGTISQLPDEVARLGLEEGAGPRHAAAGRSRANRIAAILGGASAGVFAGAVMHAGERDRASVGGGRREGSRRRGGDRRRIDHRARQGHRSPNRPSADRRANDLRRLRDDADPGETKDNTKTTQSSPKVLPEVVIYDVDLTMTLPTGFRGRAASTPSPMPSKRSMRATPIRSST